jgi:hypothetical protein
MSCFALADFQIPLLIPNQVCSLSSAGRSKHFARADSCCTLHLTLGFGNFSASAVAVVRKSFR